MPARGSPFELKGYEGERVVQRVVRLDFEKDGPVRDRLWTVEGTPAARTLVRDVRHAKVEPKED